MSDLFEQTYNPDVLSCLANLSNDEVFTPPDIANRMLDLLPEEIWHNSSVTFLDPACKSGVFLREIAKRLINGLEDEFPELSERLDHIFRNQVFGIATTELCSLLSRRSIYCSKYSNSKYSVVQFNTADGNLRYHTNKHRWNGGRCKFCGASQEAYDRDDALETYAYEFIHLNEPKEIIPMKFDVIVGNPPYQLSDGGGNGSSAIPIYHLFIEQAKKLNPRHLLMIVPARWQQGGKGLDGFRRGMLDGGKLRQMTTFNDSRQCFTGVDIAGGVCYFHWERDYQGMCRNTYVDGAGSESTKFRAMNEYPVFIADNEAIEIVRTVRKRTNENYGQIVRSRNPFGIGRGEEKTNGELALRWRGGLTTCKRNQVTTGREMIDQWKVIVSKASAEHAGQADSKGQRKIIAVIEVLSPNTVCSETYLVVDSFKTEAEAVRLSNYLKTRFARYLVWQATPTQNISKSCFAFLPVLSKDIEVTDKSLFNEFELTEIQQSIIKSSIKSIDTDLDGGE